MSSSDAIESKIKAAIGGVQRKNVPPTMKEVEEEVVTVFSSGYRLADVLRDNGFNDMADEVEGRALTNPPVKIHALTALKAGAYVPDIRKLLNYKPDIQTLTSFALEMHLNGRVLLVGHTGTGKTELVNFWCALTKQPCVRINYNQGVEVSDIIGSPQLRGDETVWVDGILPVAIREGYMVLQDECWRMPSGVCMSQQALMEPDGYLRLLGKNEDDVVQPHEDTRLVFTDNTKGTGDVSGNYGTAFVQDSSFINRITGTFEFDYLSQFVEVGILKDMYPSAVGVSELVALAGLTRTAFKKGELSLVMSMRQLKSILTRAKYAGTKQAIRTVYYASLPEEEQGVFEELYASVYGSGW